MDRLLETLRSQGQMDSAGRFSLDAERGLALLARSHAHEPHRGLLFAISSALLGGAQSVQIRLGLRTLTISDDGPGLSRLEAEGLFTHLVSRRELRLHHLALALHTLSGTRFRSLTYDTPQNHLLWTGSGFSVRPQTRKRKGNQLTVSGYLPRNPIRGVLEIESILRTVREHGRFVADRLLLNREKVSRGIVLPADTPAAIEFTHEGVPIRFRDRRPSKPSPAPFTGALWLKSQPSKSSEFILTEGGLEVQWLGGPLGYPGWEAVVEAPFLERDLQGHVIINREYRAFLQLLQAQAFELLEKVDFPDRLRPPFLAQLYPPRAASAHCSAQATGPITSRVHISWDGRFAVIPQQNCLSVVEVSTGATTLKLPPVAYRPDLHRDFAICPGTSILALIDQQNREWVDAYDCRSGELQASFHSEHQLSGLTFSPDGMTLFLFQARQAALSLDTATGQERRLYEHPISRLYETCQGFPSPDGARLALQLASDVILIDLDTGRTQATIATEFCDWSPQGDRFLARTALGHGWIGTSGQLESPGMRPPFLGSQVLVGPEDQLLCFFSGLMHVYQCRADQWEEVTLREGHFACHQGTLVQLLNGKLILPGRQIELTDPVRRLDYHHSRWIVAITQDERVQLVDLEQGSILPIWSEPQRPLDPPPSPPAPAYRLQNHSEAGLVEVWDAAQKDLLVSYQVQSHLDPLLVALGSPPISGGADWRLCLDHSGRWTLILHRGTEGFHVLAAYPGRWRWAASAKPITGAWSERTRLAFSHSGKNLAVQIGDRISLFAFREEDGELNFLQDLLLTVPNWFWSGEVLYPYLEVSHNLPESELEPTPDATAKTAETRASQACGAASSWPLVDCLPGCDRRLISDSGFLISQSSDQLIVWQLDSGKPLWAVDCPRDWCLCSQLDALAIIPEDDLQTVLFLGLATGLKLKVHQHLSPLHRLRCPLACPWLILIEWCSEMPVLLDLESGDTAPLAPEENPLYDRPLECELSPDGRWLAVEGLRYLHLFDLAARSLGQTLEGRKLQGWSGDSSRLLSLRGRELEMRSVRSGDPILCDRPLLLTDRHQLNLTGEWVLYRAYEPNLNATIWQGRRAGASGLTLTLHADLVAQADGRIAWTRAEKVFLADFPIFQARSWRLEEASRSLELSGEHLSSLSVHDRIQSWHTRPSKEYPALGQPLTAGRRAQICGLRNGLLIRSSRSLTAWDFCTQAESRCHQGWALATLQECQGRIAHHAGGESGWQVLDDQARLLWTAPEVHLLNGDLALTRSNEGQKPWVVKASSGQQLFQIQSWPDHLPLNCLAPSPIWRLLEESDLALPADCEATLLVPTPNGLLQVGQTGVLSPDQAPLPLTRRLTWDAAGELFLSVYPGTEGGCRLCSYHLGRDHFEVGPEVDYLPTGSPRLNRSGNHVALQILNRIHLAELDPATGRLLSLPLKPAVPDGCGWGWVQDKLAIWRANWIQLHSSSGQPRFRIYLRLHRPPLVVTPHGPSDSEALRAFWRETDVSLA
ncbi:hypothetical protein JST97_04660 [bacterium]|nr:hypothetical protein [bacterium]